MKRNDWILIGVVVILALTGFGVQIFSARDLPGRVVITEDGIVRGEYSLFEERTVNLDSGNTIRIQNQQVWMKEADCPDQYCVRQGKITEDGQTIICLPHKVVVEIQED